MSAYIYRQFIVMFKSAQRYFLNPKKKSDVDTAPGSFYSRRLFHYLKYCFTVQEKLLDYGNTDEQ